MKNNHTLYILFLHSYKCSGLWLPHRQPAVTEILWKLLETVAWQPLCEKVAISNLVPGEEAVMEMFFCIVLPGGSRTTLIGRREKRFSGS